MSLKSLPIAYVVADESELEGRVSLFQLLSQSEISLLRCFMALLNLPTDTGRIVSEHPPFVEAMIRVRRPPSFRKANGGARVHPQLWKDIQTSPIVVLMLGYSLPEWVKPLAQKRALAVLSPSEEVTSEAGKVESVFCGLLRGFADIREYYRVVALATARDALNERFDQETRTTLESLGKMNLFETRPRLGFIPALALPQPCDGRPAAYLLNRLSNNVDEPTLRGNSGDLAKGSFAQMFSFAMRACAALGSFEVGRELPPDLPVSLAEVAELHKQLSDPKNAERFHIFLELGRKLAKGQPPDRPLLTLPAPRMDLLRGRAPESVRLDPEHRERVRAGVRAVNDFHTGFERNVFGTKKDKRYYADARHTLVSEQRLLACQSAWLAGLSGGTPEQLDPLPGQLFAAIADLNNALDADSRKIPDLFRGVELLLSKALPEGLNDWLDKGNSPVMLFSDLPFEWTLVGDWPLCLTRPVSRIPMGFSSWETMTAALEGDATIDTRHPERVLVLDLIERHDRIRPHSDAFISVSAGLGQNYTCVSPKNAAEFNETITNNRPEIVVVDAHGKYDRVRDELTLSVNGVSAKLDDLLPNALVAPVWILSACDTSVTGAMRGCFVRKLLARGALCVIATLSRVDAFTASMFIGRLLTDIYNPVRRGAYDALEEVFFATQYTTALLYDPMLPLMRRAERDASLKKPLGQVLGGFLAWSAQGTIDVRKYRYDAAMVLGELLAKHGLSGAQSEIERAGLVRPETLLFTAFGVPGQVRLVS
jgi:hypothetical protein